MNSNCFNLFWILLLFSELLMVNSNQLTLPYSTLNFALNPTPESQETLLEYALDVSNPNSDNYGNYLTLDQINNLIEVNQRDLMMVDQWLSTLPSNFDYNLIKYVDGFRLDMPIYLIEKEFNVTMNVIEKNRKGNVRYYTTQDYTLPTFLKNSVHFVEGLRMPPKHSRLAYSRITKKNILKNNDIVDSGLVGREVLLRLYNIPNKTLSGKASLGLMEYQGTSGFSPDDLAYIQNVSNQPSNPVNQSHIIGVNNPPDEESELDVQIASQVASNVDLWYEDYTGWLYGWAVDFYNRKEVPDIVSLSWGWNEEDQCQIASCTNFTSQEYVKRCNYEYMKLAVRGITIVIASGDAGSPGRTNEECSDEPEHINPVYPGSSQWALSVGATYLLATNKTYNYTTPACHQVNCANGTQEQMVNFNYVEWTSGSGFDRWVETPNWQAKEVLHYLSSGVELPNQTYWNQYGRAYPDLSAIGHNCLVDSYGELGPVDGTSCSAPLMAGIIAILNDHQLTHGRPKLGFSNPLLYQMARDDPSTFHDITVGNSTCTEGTCCGPDYGFVATKGWDPVAGLGTPNVGQMLKYLDSMKW